MASLEQTLEVIMQYEVTEVCMEWRQFTDEVPGDCHAEIPG